MSLSFGPFHLNLSRRLLLQGEEHVPISSRALDILIALVEQRGSLVTKEQLLAAAWPKTNVHEANLRVHIGGIRKLLRDGQSGVRYVVSEAGRGYRFVAPVVVIDDAPPPLDRSNDNDPSRQPEPVRTNLTPVIGRSKVVDSLAEQLPKRRFITIVGPGGIGKTTVALAVAERVALPRSCEVCFVDFAPLSDRTLVYNQLIASLGVQASDNQISALAAYLREREILIVLDNCEHVIDFVTPLAEGTLGGAPKLQILATSREPLRAEGEWVHRLTPLGLPTPGSRLRADQAMGYPAIQLFVERARASLDDFELIDDADAQTIAGICRRLDGLPLAIELAASRMEAFGLHGLASLLNDRLRLPTLGRRTAAPRHRTLASMLDWSYETLPDLERVILRRLAVFAGPFSLEAANSVASDARIDSSVVVDCIANLVDKSLVAADISGASISYRLLDTTRVYALQKLRDGKEYETVSRRHAEYYRIVFESSVGERENNPVDWLAAHRGEIDNVRTALDWAFADGGDAELGVGLTLAAIFLWTHLSLTQECCARVQKALSRLENNVSNARTRMQLQAALAGALGFVRGAGPEREAAWSGVLAIAENLGDTEYHLRGLWGLWSSKCQSGEFRAMQELAKKFASLAAKSTGGLDDVVADRMLGLTAHFLGHQEEARRRLERALARYTPNPTHITRFRLDHRILTRAYLAVVLWLLGFPDQAIRLVEICVGDAEEGGHSMSLTYALAQSACPVALACGALTAAARYINLLRERGLLHGTEIWGTMARYYDGMLMIGRGEWAAGAARSEGALRDLPANAFRQRYTPLFGEVAEALIAVGQTERAANLVEKAMELAERDQELWGLAELQRVRGEAALKSGDEDLAEACLHRSLECSRRQKVLSLELRAATCLARMRMDQGRSQEGYDLLEPVYRRFTEGFETPDLKTAKSLLDLLR